MNRWMKWCSFAFFAAGLTACGNLSAVDEKGKTEKPIFPLATEAVFNHEKESWLNVANFNAIKLGMHKELIREFLGDPHFFEGFYAVREWDYIFNYRENGEHKQCQFKILFDKEMKAQTFLWYPNGCRSDVRFNLSGDFLFEYNKDSLSVKGKEVVAELAQNLIKMNAQSILIEGHTDRIGSEAYNLALSQRRADTVANALTAAGVNAQIKAIGLGKAHQIKDCSGNDQAAKDCLAPNRRVEIHAMGTKVSEGNNKAGKTGPAIIYDKP